MLIHLSITSLIQHHHTHWKTESVSALEPNPAALVSDVLGEDRSAVSRTPRRHAAGEASRLIDTRYSILSHLTRTREAGRSSAALKLISWSFTRSGSTVSRYSVLMRLAAQTKKKPYADNPARSACSFHTSARCWRRDPSCPGSRKRSRVRPARRFGIL